MENVLATIINEKHLEVQALAATKDLAALDYAAKKGIAASRICCSPVP